ncbi:hypothetical protein SS50377_21601 [Spironucleus salmonicida]|uniref:Uncharacterized protein n=1 Tax=Spironucleus salmonicida TaxID=348837 RepID=V6LR02_9EUKA|nr:hypothetical protein SS50377_21601 [Spironucleus salmonicida]|eukprot:EST46136.1 Hypothetical protein SS50377_13853 [Spironucleus salmonicida]
MLVLLAVEIPDCYSGATVQYNQNLETATVMLVSNLDESCQRFLDEVKLSLIFHDGFHNVHYIYDSFNYSESQTIVMLNVDIINDDVDPPMPLYARLNISNIAYWTGVRVSYVGNQVSQMDQCFDQLRSNFTIVQRNFYFTVGITAACLDEISTGAFQYQYQFNEKADTFAIKRKKDYPLSHNCQNIVEAGLSYLYCQQFGNFVLDLQTPFTEATVEFTIQASGINYNAEIKFDTVIVGTVAGLVESVQVQYFQDLFYVEMHFTQNNSIKNSWRLLTLGSNLYIYRVTARTPTGSYTFSFQYDTFDFNNVMLINSCNGDQECMEQMIYINSVALNSDFYLDITGFQDITLKGSTGTSFSSRLSCFRRVVIQIYSPTRLCIELERSSRYFTRDHCLAIKENEVTTATATGINESNSGQVVFSQKQEFRLNFKDPRVCFEVQPDEVGQVAAMRESGIYLQIQFTQGNNTISMLGHHQVEKNYQIVEIVIYLFGTIILLTALVDTIWKMIVFIRVSKSFKKK